MFHKSEGDSQTLVEQWLTQLKHFIAVWSNRRQGVISERTNREVLQRMITAAIRRDHSAIIDEQARLAQRAGKCTNSVADIDARWWLGRWVASGERKQLLADIAHIKRAQQQLAGKLEQAASASFESHILNQAAEDAILQRSAAIAHNKLIDDIEKYGNDLVLAAMKWRRLDIDALEQSLAETTGSPSLWIDPQPTQALAALRALGEDMTARFSRLASHRSAVNQASTIWNAAKQQGLIQDPNLTMARRRSASTLESVSRCAAPDQPLQELLERLVDPATMPSADTWIILWNALEASRRCANTVSAPSGEDAGTGQWCAAWETQSEAWSEQTLRCLGIDKDSVQTALMRTHGTAAETSSGADVILFVLVDLPSRRYCKAIGLQFKRHSGNGTLLPLRTDQRHQLATLARLHAMSEKRWASMHAVMRAGVGVLDMLPAVPIRKTIVALADAGRDNPKAKYTDLVKTVDWSELCELLPTVLVGELTNPASTFASCDEAFAWYESETGRAGLPSFFLVQSVGAAPKLMREQVRNLRDTLRQRGISAHEITQDRSPGPTR